MSNSAINTQVAQQKIGNVQNQADTSPVYSAGEWSLKNASAVTSVKIDNSGNVGIGTASPAQKLDISGTSANPITLSVNNQTATTNAAGAKINFSYNGTATGFILNQFDGSDFNTVIQANRNLRFFTGTSGGTERMIIDSSGNVGIGIAPFSVVALDVKEPDAGQDLILGLTAGTGARAQIRSIAQPNNTSSALSFSTTSAGASAERMRIEPSGNIKIGTNGLDPSSSVYGVQIGYPGNTYWVSSNAGTSGYAHMAFLNASGIVGSISTAGSGTVYNTSSDYRLKKDVKPISDALSKVSTLKPCTYKWKFDDSDGVGFIAHELAEVCPEAVTGEKDAVNEDGSINPQGIDPSKLVSILTAAIQELSAKVDAQAEEIKALKAS